MKNGRWQVEGGRFFSSCALSPCVLRLIFGSWFLGFGILPLGPWPFVLCPWDLGFGSWDFAPLSLSLDLLPGLFHHQRILFHLGTLAQDTTATAGVMQGFE